MALSKKEQIKQKLDVLRKKEKEKNYRSSWDRFNDLYGKLSLSKPLPVVLQAFLHFDIGLEDRAEEIINLG